MASRPIEEVPPLIKMVSEFFICKAIEVVKDYQELNFPHYLSPFRVDNGDFWCFDTRHPDKNGEFPVVIWSHNENGIEKNPDHQWRNFIDWLDKTMEAE